MSDGDAARVCRIFSLPSLSTRITRVELIPTLRPSLTVSKVKSTVKFITRSTMASARTVTLTHIIAPSEEPAVKVTGIVIAMKSPSVSVAEMKRLWLGLS